MTINLPAKKYYTFPELAARLQCTVQDLRHFVLEGELTPSAFIDGGNYWLCELKPHDDYEKTGNTYPSEIQDCSNQNGDNSVREWRYGFHYLVFQNRTGVNQCEFSYVSKEARSHDCGGIVYRLESVEDINSVFANGVVMADELDRFIALKSSPILDATTEKNLATRERDTLLTIIAALAKEARINIYPPGKAASYIEGLTELLGARVSKRAIEGHLKKIPDALETRMK